MQSPWPPLPRPPMMACVTPSPDVSPVSAATTNGHFPRDSFSLNLSTLPDASSFVLKSALKSPHLLESPNGFGPSNGILNGTFKKRPRNMSQSSGTDREMSSEAAQSQPNGAPPTSNGPEPRPTTKKRPSTDTIDYPRRRATIAVPQPSPRMHSSPIDMQTSAKSAGRENRGAMVRGPNAGFAPSSMQNAYTGSQASSWTPATSSSSSTSTASKASSRPTLPMASAWLHTRRLQVIPRVMISLPAPPAIWLLWAWFSQSMALGHGTAPPLTSRPCPRRTRLRR